MKTDIELLQLWYNNQTSIQSYWYKNLDIPDKLRLAELINELKKNERNRT